MPDRGKKVHIGTFGWSYDHWKGPFYPDRLNSEGRLSFYARNFDTVEINSTFYGLPSFDTLRKYKHSVPDHFISSAKAGRYITHQKKLNNPKQSTREFFERIATLGDQLGPVLFQLPPRWNKHSAR